MVPDHPLGRSGVVGGVAEVGVHHGKSFAALCLLNADSGGANGQNLALAIDVFGDQIHNTDESGEGDLEIFQATVDRWQHRGSFSLSARPMSSREHRRPPTPARPPPLVPPP